MTIKYRHGYPTKRCMQELIDDFFSTLSNKPRISHGYGKNGAYLVWESKVVNNQIDNFILYLKNRGIFTGIYRLYESPMTGNLPIKRLD